MANILGKSDAAFNFDYNFSGLKPIQPVSLGFSNNYFDTPQLTLPLLVNIPKYGSTEKLVTNNVSPKTSDLFDGPELYTPKSFDLETKFREMYGTQASKRDRRRFNKWANSEERWALQDAFEREEFDKLMASWDARQAALKNWTKNFSLDLPALNTTPMQNTTPAQITKPTFNELYWLLQAKLLGMGSILEVKDFLKANGLIVDGKAGKNTIAKWRQLKSLDSLETYQPNVSLNPVLENTFSLITPWANYKQTEEDARNLRLRLANTTQNSRVVTKPLTQAEPLSTADRHYSPKAYANFGGDESVFNNSKYRKMMLPDGTYRYVNDEGSSFYNNGRVSTKYGTYNYSVHNGSPYIENYTVKHQQGGKMNNQEEMQKAFMAFLILDAAELGMQIQSEQDLQAYAEQLGEEGLKVKYQEFMLKMQGQTPAAKYGAKLNYIKKLKGDCPEGYELAYFKSGGMFKKGCKICESKKAMMQKGGNAIDKFKSLKKHLLGGTFSEAFNAARALGNRFFSYNNKLYNTMTKLESSSAEGRKAWAQKFKDNSTYADNARVNASQTGGWEGHKGYNAGRFDENGNWRQLKGKPTKWELRIVGYTEDKNGNIVPIKKWIGVNHKQYQGPVADVKNRNIYKSKTNDKKAGITYNADGTALDSTKKGTYKIVDNGKLKAPVAVGVTGNLPKPKPESPKNNPNAPLYKYNSADLIDIIIPTPSSVIGSLIGTAVTGKPQVAPSPINITGYVKDLANEDYLNFATRAADAYLTLGAPGSSQFIRGVKLGSFVKPQPVSYTQFMGRNANGTYKPLGLYKQQIGNLISEANEWSGKNLWNRFWSEKPQFGYYSTNVRNGMGRFTPMEESVKTGTRKAMDLFGYYVARPNVKAPNMDFTTFGAPAVSQYGATVGGLQDQWEDE